MQRPTERPPPGLSRPKLYWSRATAVAIDAWRLARGEHAFMQHWRQLAQRTPKCGWTLLSALVHFVARQEGQPLRKYLRVGGFNACGRRMSHSQWERLLQQYSDVFFLRNGKVWLAKPQRHWQACNTQFPGQNARRCTCAILSLPLPGEVAEEEETPEEIADREAVAEAARENESYNRANDVINSCFAHWRWPGAGQGPHIDVEVRTENSFDD